MSSSTDSDALLKKALYLLHTDDPQSATDLRLMVDELIKQRYGPSKMLSNLVTEKHLELERSFPGIRTEQPEQSAAEATAGDEVINLTNSPINTVSDSPDTIAGSDDVPMLTIPTSEEVENLKEFGDLNCCVCGEMVFTATNRLIECSQCGSLYHQECHMPTITNEETCDEKERTWQCNSCNDKPSTSKAAAAAAAVASASAVEAASAVVTPAVEEPIPLISKTKSSASSSASSSSSNSSSEFHKKEHLSSSSSKRTKSSSSSSKSHKEDRSGASSTSSTRTSTIITPSINIVSAPEKSTASSSSKSSSSHSSSKSSSKSSSRHHDSSKRKLNK